MEKTLYAHPVFPALGESRKALYDLLDAFSGEGFNEVPFKDSWTAAQVADHITRSNRSITQALDLPGMAIDRQPDLRAQELKDMFLDFTVKFQAPGFILPGQDVYDRTVLINQLVHSFDGLLEVAQVTDLGECISHPAFGEITKLELLHFVVYHTQRHIHQVQHIYQHVEHKPYKFLSFLFTPPLSLKG